MFSSNGEYAQIIIVTLNNYKAKQWLNETMMLRNTGSVRLTILFYIKLKSSLTLYPYFYMNKMHLPVRKQNFRFFSFFMLKTCSQI